MKKIIKLITSLMLCFSFVQLNINAQNDDEYYQETGTIYLDEITLVNENNELRVLSNSTVDSARNKALLEIELNKSEELSDFLMSCLSDGVKPQAIGYTKVYLKIVNDNVGKHLEPMTVEDMVQPTAIGPDRVSPGGNFTLYTAASYVGNDIYASSIGHFESLNPGEPNFDLSEVPLKDTYISLSAPTGYIIESSDIETIGLTASQTEDSESTVLWRINKNSGLYNDVNLSGVMLKNTSSTNKKISSSFVNQWGTFNVNVSISGTGPNLSVSGSTSYWKISSSVTLK